MPGTLRSYKTGSVIYFLGDVGDSIYILKSGIVSLLHHSIETGEECVYAGLSWHSIKDDETAKEFKERAQKEMEKVFGENIKCEFICEMVSS